MLVLNKILKLIRLINNSFKYIGVGCLLISCMLLFIESMVRYIWNVSIIVVDEIGAIGMYMFVVFNIAALYSSKEHLKVDFFVHKFSKSIQHNKKYYYIYLLWYLQV